MYCQIVKINRFQEIPTKIFMKTYDAKLKLVSMRQLIFNLNLFFFWNNPNSEEWLEQLFQQCVFMIDQCMIIKRNSCCKFFNDRTTVSTRNIPTSFDAFLIFFVVCF